MSQGHEDRPAFGQKSAEIVVAAVFLLLGGIVVFDSIRLGARWAEDGPQAGYFPFYVGLLVCIASAVNLGLAFFGKKEDGRVFVGVAQLKMVLAVLVPAIIYAAMITWTGIYAASVIFIAFFMRWLGKYAWWKVAVVSIGTMAVFFVIFESWFKVPLPKGPLENLLGLG
jgi:putative tricarboxylic transport membrane protein